MTEQSKEEFGWVFEHKDSPAYEPKYFTAEFSNEPPFPIPWSTNHLKAIRFARKEDAEQMAIYLKMRHAVRIAEHGWM